MIWISVINPALTPLILVILLLVSPRGFAEESGVTVEEAFETEMGELMVCRFSSVHPAMTISTLHLWLGLRDPYGTYQFPALFQGGGSTGGLTLHQQATRNLERQRKIIQQLHATPVSSEIRPLHEAITGMFERENGYSEAVWTFFQDGNASSLFHRFEAIAPLTEQEKDRILKWHHGISREDPRTLQDDFINNHVMLDKAGKHFTDYNIAFMREHEIQVNCRCTAHCR